MAATISIESPANIIGQIFPRNRIRGRTPRYSLPPLKARNAEIDACFPPIPLRMCTRARWKNTRKISGDVRIDDWRTDFAKEDRFLNSQIRKIQIGLWM